MERTRKSDICVFVVEDDPGMSTLYEGLLASIGVEVRLFRSGDEFFRAWSPTWRGGLILDLRMPGMGGIEVLRRLRALESTLPAIVVTGFAEVRSTVQAMKLGAVELLEKPFANSEFVEAVQAMIEQARRDGLARAVRDEVADALAALSAREREVADLIARGLTSREIGQLLDISPRTVDVHRARVLEKLNCASSVELAALLSRFSREAT